METRIRALRPYKHVHDDGATHYRTGVIWSVADDLATVRIFCAPGVVRDFVIAVALLPATSIGFPLAARLAGDGAWSFTLAEVRAAHWGHGGPSDEVLAVAQGEFHLPVLPRELTGESDFYDWAE